MITLKHMRGLSLVELMVALTISAFLIFGATQVYVDSRNAYNVNETIARLQENARYAMAVIEPDIRMGNYWGLVKSSIYVTTGKAAQSPPATTITNAQSQYCGTNFAVDLDLPIQGDNNNYVLSNTRQAACNTVAGTGWLTSPQLSADTLIVRRASNVNTVSTVNVPQICSDRLTARLYINGSACGAAPSNQVNNLIVNAYYVDNNSAQAVGFPSLRRKSLASVGGVIQFVDQEIMAGVEDMQVQWGIEIPSAARPPVGVPTRYVNPSLPLPAGALVVSVRVWLMVRSETPEPGFIDNRPAYEYGDRLAANGVAYTLSAVASRAKAFQPSADPSTSFTAIKKYRRLLISRTFQLRNSYGT